MVGRPLLLRVRMLPAETTTADVTELAERLLGCWGGCGCCGGAATEGRGTYCNRKKDWLITVLSFGFAGIGKKIVKIN